MFQSLTSLYTSKRSQWNHWH